MTIQAKLLCAVAVSGFAAFATLPIGDPAASATELERCVRMGFKGAMLHVLGDLLGSVAAIGAAIVIWTTGWTPIDPILSVLLSALILRSGWALLKSSLNILMEGVPGNVVVDEVRGALNGIEGVKSIAHLHIWSITSGRPAATLELSLAAGADAAATTQRVKTVLADSYAIGHATIEIDWDGSEGTCPLPQPAAQRH